MFNKFYFKSQKGFTLIELLIVIVIIGILAGVLIAVIDPVQQQNRAKDANVTATVNKVGLVTQGHVSAYGTPPTDTQFLANLQNATSPTATCNGNDGQCLFTVQGNEPSATSCIADGWHGGGTGPCNYRYVALAADGSIVVPNLATKFRLYVKSYGLSDKVFVYDSRLGYMSVCPVDVADDDDVTSGGAGGCTRF